MRTSSSTFRVLLPALLISLGGTFHFGYQFMVMNPSEGAFKNFINGSFYSHYGTYVSQNLWSYLWPVVENMQCLGGLIGTCFITYLLHNWARKRCFYLTNSFVIVSCVLQGISKVANAWELLTFGRFLCGLSQGVQQGLQPVYLDEISPKDKKGLIGSLTGFLIEFGFLIASILAFPFILGDDSRWPYLFLVEAIPSILVLSVLPCFPESPKYLVNKGDYHGAEKALKYFGRTDQDIKDELEELKRESTTQSAKSEKVMSIKEIFSKAYIKKGVLLGWIVIIASSYSGIVALSFFSTGILINSGVPESDAQYGTIGMAILTVVGALISSVILDHFGRRPVILGSLAVLLILNILFIIFANLTRVHSLTWSASANIGVVALICLTYGVGLAGTIWFLTVELVPQRARANAHMSAMVVQWIATLSAGLIFYPLQDAINEFCFLLHVVPLTLALIYVAVALPETKNKSTAEVLNQLGYQEDKEIIQEKF